MNKIVATIGAAALTTTAFHSANAQNLSPQESTKAWSVGASLRGFYDDNYLIAPRGSEQSSFGFEVKPTVGLNLPLEQTYIGLDYTFSGRWYEDNTRSSEPWDTTHIVNTILNHEFTSRVTTTVKDTFTYSSRPQVTDPDLPPVTSTRRVSQNNLNNRGNVTLAVGLTPRLGMVVGYENRIWDYEDDNPANEVVATYSTPASLSARLDRMEQRIPINLRYQIAPETTAKVGYDFGMVDFTSDEFITKFTSGPIIGVQKADLRNNRSHRAYLGVERNFSPVLNASASAGITYTEYYNDPSTDNGLTPYAALSAQYAYTTGSRLEAGFTLQQSQTDLLGTSANQVTQDRMTTSVYGRIVHEFMPQLHGTLFAQYQRSEFNGGSYDGQVESFYIASASLSYQVNPFLSADLGYSFDYMDSDITFRGFTRNRIYLGVTASY